MPLEATDYPSLRRRARAYDSTRQGRLLFNAGLAELFTVYISGLQLRFTQFVSGSPS